jgi:hypothetical protein
LFLDFIIKLGKQFIFIELVSLVTWLQYIIGPLLFKEYGILMRVPYDTYFDYAIVAASLFVIGLQLPTYKLLFSSQANEKLRKQLIDYFSTNTNGGRTLLLIGLPVWLIQPFLPSSLSYIGSLISLLLLVGMCFLIFSNEKKDIILIIGGFIAILSNTLLHGMIGTSIFWLIIIFNYRSIRHPSKLPVFIKLFGVLVFAFVLMVFQSAKTVYRVHTWKISDTELSAGSKRSIEASPRIFYNLIKERVFNPNLLFDKKSMISFVARLNQGYILSRAMRWVPRSRNHGLGEITIINTITAFIPRILYPSKPTVGTGEYYYKYTGDKLGKFNSVTLGSLGDAYADFGKYGIFFTLIYGLIVGYTYRYYVNLHSSNVVLIFWFAIIFFSSITVNEVSVPGYINALFKAFIFIYFTRRIFNYFNVTV